MGNTMNVRQEWFLFIVFWLVIIAANVYAGFLIWESFDVWQVATAVMSFFVIEIVVLIYLLLGGD